MVYAHRILHLFLGLFILYSLVFIVSTAVSVASKDVSLIIPILSNKYIWMRYATEPLFIGMLGSIVLSFAMRWSYLSSIEGLKLAARNSWGVKEEVLLDEIHSIHIYKIPLLGLAKLTRHGKASLWVTVEAAEACKRMRINVENAGES